MWLSSGILIWSFIVELIPERHGFLVKDANLIMYADDHVLFATGLNHNIVSSRLQDQGELAMSWYRDNFLLLIQETLTQIQCKPTKALQIGDQITANTPLIKLLGVEIDDKLNFTNHISNICIKVSQKVGILMRLSNSIPGNESKTNNLQIIHPTSLNILPLSVA